jgi:hypothetical protein
METQVMYGVAVVPLIIAAVGLAKQAGLPGKYAGLVSWGLGVGVAFAYGLTEAGWNVLQCIIIGSALGLTAAGLYSTQKNAREPSIESPGGTE